MKQENKFKQTKETRKTRVENSRSLKKYVYGVVGSFAFFMIATYVYFAYMFFATHSLNFQSPIIFQSPVLIEDKDFEIISPLPIASPAAALVPQAEAAELETVKAEPANDSDHEIASYIASFDWDYNTAIRIAKSENFWNLTGSFDCSRQGHVNSNGTRDHGLWQINDIHINSGAISLADALDCKKATDFAYKLYKARNNWTAWAAYNNGSYKGHSVIEL